MKDPTMVLLIPMTSTFDEPVTEITLSNALFRCTRCGGVKPMSEFGKLRMNNGKVYNQAQCKVCRFRYKSLTGETNGQDT